MNPHPDSDHDTHRLEFADETREYGDEERAVMWGGEE